MPVLHSRKSLFIILTASMLALAACGGGKRSSSSQEDADPPPVTLPTTTFSGIFDGQIASTGQPITSLLQADGSYYLVYSDASGAQAPAGAVMGSGTLAGQNFNSPAGLDSSLVGSGTQTAASTGVTATYKQGQSFDGTLAYAPPKGNETFSGAFNSSYQQLPTLSALAGVYTGAIATSSVKEDNLQLTIASDGSISGKLSCGCNITATLSPRSDGTSYAAGLSFKGGEHPLSNKSMGGNVYFDAARKRLYIIGRLSGTTDSAIFVGTKP